MSLSDEQKAVRLTGIGGSEIAAVAGLSPHMTQLDVWRAKIEGREIEESKAMKRGRLLEPAVAQWYSEDTGAKLREPGTIRHQSHKIALATPDRIAETTTAGDKILEIKTAGIWLRDEWGETGTDLVPQHYLVQVVWEQFCTGIHGEADVAALIGGDDFRILHVQYDQDLADMLLESAERFWHNHVETKKPPALDGSESTKEWILSKFPVNTGELAVATQEMERLATGLIAAQRESEDSKMHYELLRNEFRQLLGSADGAHGDGWKASFRCQKGRLLVDWEAVAKEAGATDHIIQKHTRIGAGSRPFKFTTSKR